MSTQCTLYKGAHVYYKKIAAGTVMESSGGDMGPGAVVFVLNGVIKSAAGVTQPF